MQLHLNKRFEWKELPDMQFFKSEIDRQAKDITIGETLFFKEHGVKTEGEYKKKAMAEGFITKQSHQTRQLHVTNGSDLRLGHGRSQRVPGQADTGYRPDTEYP